MAFLRSWSGSVAAALLLLASPLSAYSGPLTNQLHDHASPYLALHGQDPVAWQQWDAAAMARARREGKLLYLSIGYFSCHWCHVMQRESFQDPAIARWLNAHFIPVKIDRELEPALDARMLAFAEATQGMGGWPLNVFLTPAGDPLHAVLYRPPSEFHEIIKRLQGLWETRHEELSRLARINTGDGQGPGIPRLEASQIESYAGQVVTEALALADPFAGGFGEQNKFPSVPQLWFLLTHADLAAQAPVREFLYLTLDAMAENALQDHVGGGFFRYTVDPGWRTPHFEKMLYDNALLARLYLRAWQRLGDERYRATAERTLAFLHEAMRSPEGAYMAALSSVDDKGVEGGYYLWGRETLDRALGPTVGRAFRLRWGLDGPPGHEGGYLPIAAMPVAAVAARLETDEAQVEQWLAAGQAALLRVRARRVLPRDDKLLAGWNGLALTAFAEAAKVTGRPPYREVASDLQRYLTTVLWDGQVLMRAAHRDRAVGSAGLEDYAYVAEGQLAWAELTQKEADYRLALDLAEAGWRRFYGGQGWRLGEAGVLAAGPGQDVIADGPMPAPSAVLLEVSLTLAACLKQPELRRRALSALNSGHTQLAKAPFWHASQVGAMLAALRGPQEEG